MKVVRKLNYYHSMEKQNRILNNGAPGYGNAFPLANDNARRQHGEYRVSLSLYRQRGRLQEGIETNIFLELSAL
jgi:hypothetical protein